MEAVTEQDLLKALEEASLGSSQAAEKFIQLLLDSEVYLPLEIKGAEQKVVSPAGEKYLSVKIEGKRVVPVFSSYELLDQWSNGAYSVVKRGFREFLHLLMDNTWLHLNPGQEYGKEFSPWEIDLLRKAGAAAIPEILAELSFEYASNLEIKSTTQIEPNFKARLTSFFEAYPEIEQGFMVTVCEEKEGNKEITALGIKRATMTKEREALFLEEIKGICQQRLIENKELIVIDNIDKKQSPYNHWFNNAIPFYYAISDVTKNNSIFSRINKIIFRRN